MEIENNGIVTKVSEYYSDKIRRYGATPKGVDWNGKQSQCLRFEQLSKVLPDDNSEKFTLADLGCGYGALFDYLEPQYENYSYFGYDVSLEMTRAVSKRLEERSQVAIKCFERIERQVDFGIASGIFSVRLDSSDSAWSDYIFSVIENMNDHCTKGFAFNCLTSYSDKDKMRNYLYYADPTVIFDYCKKNCSNNVALLHDYGLYEFTILVRK